MNDSPRPTITGDRPATPRWVKGLGIAIVVALLVVVVVMLLSGGQHGPGIHTGTGNATGQPSTATASAAAGGVGGPAAADAATRSIEVTTSDSMTFEPGSVEVAAGETVTFVVTNAGQVAHEFTLGDAAMQREHADAMAHMPSGVAHELPNSIALQPGETKRLTWQFGQAGTLEYACHEPGHYDAGMHGPITVS
jgi:uncharacterized cupredoxin-like copper-binding protein